MRLSNWLLSSLGIHAVVLCQVGGSQRGCVVCVKGWEQTLFAAALLSVEVLAVLIVAGHKALLFPSLSLWTAEAPLLIAGSDGGGVMGFPRYIRGGRGVKTLTASPDAAPPTATGTTPHPPPHLQLCNNTPFILHIHHYYAWMNKTSFKT